MDEYHILDTDNEETYEFRVLRDRMYSLLNSKKKSQKIKMRAFMVMLELLNETKSFFYDIVYLSALMKGTDTYNKIIIYNSIPTIEYQMSLLNIFMESISKFISECNPNWERLPEEVQKVNNFMYNQIIYEVRGETVESCLLSLETKSRLKEKYSAESVYKELLKLKMLLENSKFAEPLATCAREKYLRYKSYQIVE